MLTKHFTNWQSCCLKLYKPLRKRLPTYAHQVPPDYQPFSCLFLTTTSYFLIIIPCACLPNYLLTDRWRNTEYSPVYLLPCGNSFTEVQRGRYLLMMLETLKGAVGTI